VAPRIAVIGSCCSGKTTLATQLAEILGMRERVELWHPGNFENWRGIWVLSSYTIRTHHRRRRYWPSRFEGKTLVRLRTSAEANAWLAERRRSHPSPG
jgi:molybdopterin-guanine dinucleotide biosynthesis protein